MDELRIEILRDPRLGDEELAQLAAIERECYTPLQRYSRRTLRQFLAWPGCLLTRAWRGGVLAGFQLSNVNAGQLITLDVMPEFRRQGIGAALLRRTLEAFTQAGLLLARCEISVNNEASIRLHEKLGFWTLGIIREYYEDGADAICMAKRVDPLRPLTPAE